jgi:hypothetical protein
VTCGSGSFVSLCSNISSHPSANRQTLMPQLLHLVELQAPRSRLEGADECPRMREVSHADRYHLCPRRRKRGGVTIGVRQTLRKPIPTVSRSGRSRVKSLVSSFVCFPIIGESRCKISLQRSIREDINDGVLNGLFHEFAAAEKVGIHTNFHRIRSSVSTTSLILTA